MTQDIPYADYGCDAQSSEARGCPAKDAFKPEARNDTYKMLNQILVSRAGGFTSPTNVDAAGAENAGVLQRNYVNVNNDLASSFLTNGSQVVDDFTTCNCDGAYINTGCGCDCNPYGWDWNHPTGGSCMEGSVLPMLLLIALAIVVIYCLMKK